MPRKYDICVARGTYTGRDGEEKTDWLKVGVVMSNDNGFYILMDKWFNPAGITQDGPFAASNNILLSLFPPRPQEGQAPQQQQQAPRTNVRPMPEAQQAPTIPPAPESFDDITF